MVDFLAPNSRESLEAVVKRDVEEGHRKDLEYGASWKSRGGVGSFMMLARKWDRLENFVRPLGYDIFKALEADRRPEGIIDDIRDLRRYLMQVEAEAEARGWLITTEAIPVSAQPHIDMTGQSRPYGYIQEPVVVVVDSASVPIQCVPRRVYDNGSF